MKIMCKLSERVKSIIIEVGGLDINEEIVNETSITKDLVFDSLDCIELIMGLEKEFNISIDDDKAAEVDLFGDIVKEIEKLIK